MNNKEAQKISKEAVEKAKNTLKTNTDLLNSIDNLIEYNASKGELELGFNLYSVKRGNYTKADILALCDYYTNKEFLVTYNEFLDIKISWF